jgi:hypothetical protein
MNTGFRGRFPHRNIKLEPTADLSDISKIFKVYDISIIWLAIPEIIRVFTPDICSDLN